MMGVATLRASAAHAAVQRQQTVVLPRKVTIPGPLWARAQRCSIALRRSQIVSAARRSDVEAVGKLNKMEMKARTVVLKRSQVDT